MITCIIIFTFPSLLESTKHCYWVGLAGTEKSVTIFCSDTCFPPRVGIWRSSLPLVLEAYWSVTTGLSLCEQASTAGSHLRSTPSSAFPAKMDWNPSGTRNHNQHFLLYFSQVFGNSHVKVPNQKHNPFSNTSPKFREKSRVNMYTKYMPYAMRAKRFLLSPHYVV